MVEHTSSNTVLRPCFFCVKLARARADEITSLLIIATDLKRLSTQCKGFLEKVVVITSTSARGSPPRHATRVDVD
jgi:hypothetical protein